MKRCKLINGRLLTVLLALVLGIVIASCSSTPPFPPKAQLKTHIDTVHGDIRSDDYFWLREKENPKVIDYLKAENAYTEAIMKHTEKFQDKLFNELKSRINETDLSVPVKQDSFYYYSRTVEGQQYRIYCRKEGSLDGEEEILLDLNVLSEGHGYFRLGVHLSSPDHKLLAYAIDTSGGEIYTLYTKYLETGQLLEDKIDSCDGSAVWAADNKTLFYTTLDHTTRPWRLYRHKLGSSQDKDVLIYQENDETYGLYIHKSKSEEYIFMALWANASTEYRYLKANNPTGKFKTIYKRQPDIEYDVSHRGNYFYIVTNEEATNFRVMRTTTKKPFRPTWKEVIPHRDSVLVTGISMFRDYMVVYERENGLRQIRIENLKNNSRYYVEFDEPIYSVRGTGNVEFDTDVLRFRYYSLITPRSIFDYNMTSKKREMLKQYEVLGGYNPDDYQMERVFAKASDGTMIPISMMYKKGMVKDGDNPLYLYGYGSYGSSMDPYFSSNRLSLVNRGFIFAMAHVRGGSEMGRYWYDDGKLLKKMNTFTDFIACAENLISEKYTSPDNLTIAGGSAGGLLIGAVVNMRPDLFKVAVADVPFVDVINTMLDPTIPLTVNEYTEWGNPEEKEYYDYMLTYSPYDNVVAKNYPNMLITAGLNDPRVQYWEPAKWTAKLRTMKTDNNRLLLKTNMGAGHGGASGRYDYLEEIAFEYAYILDLMGMMD